MREAGEPTGPVEQLILRETPKAFHMAMALTRNSVDSEELVQEASYRILLRRQDYDASKCGAAWLKAVVLNLFIDSRRSAERRHGVPLNQPMGEGLSFVDTISSEEPGELERLERQESVEIVQRTLKKMSAVHRKVLVLCDMEGMSYQEAAHVTGIPLGTFRSRLHRARRAFRKAHPELTYV